MAQTYTHSDNVLSKVKFGNTTYYLKDADVRAILDTFGDVVTYDVATTIADNGTGLVTADQVYNYVGSQMGTVAGALKLLPGETDHTAVANPEVGNVVVEEDGSEWLYEGGTTGWREIGNEGAYVLKTFEIAGLDMADDITAAELKQALSLGALAYKDNGSVAITTIDSLNSFTTGAAGTYNVSSTQVSVPATYDALDVTPAGSVELTAGTAAGASYDKTTSITVGSAAPGQDQSANYTPSGTVTVTDVTVTPNTGNVATVTDAGTAYQLTAGSCTKAADTTSAFATAGVIATIGTDNTGEGGADESETLIFTAATTSNAVTASGAITYVDPTLSGSLPTFGTASVVTSIASASGTASFSGDGTIISATPAYTAAAATMTQPTYTAAFTGTAKSVTPTVATTTAAAGADASVTVSSETITPTANSTEKTATVTFGNNS